MAINYSANDLLNNASLMQEFVNDTQQVLTDIQIGVAGGGNSSVTYSDTPPSNPSQGDQWFNGDSDDLNLYTWNATAQAWIDTSPGGGGGGGSWGIWTDSEAPLPIDGEVGDSYYLAAVPLVRLFNGTTQVRTPAIRGQDNDTLWIGPVGTDYNLSSNTYIDTAGNTFWVADSDFSNVQTFTVRGVGAGFFSNNSFIDVNEATTGTTGKFVFQPGTLHAPAGRFVTWSGSEWHRWAQTTVLP